MIALGPRPTRRRPGLTPMIDVVFLLLIFFMLAARLGPAQGLQVQSAGGGGEWTGPPRLVDVMPETLRLNGVSTDVTELPDRLRALVSTPSDAIVLRPRDGATLQRLLDVVSALESAGLRGAVLLGEDG